MRRIASLTGYRLPGSVADCAQRIRTWGSAGSLFEAFHHFSAVAAELVLLTSKALENASMATFDAGAKSFGVGAAGSAVMIAPLSERNGRD